jgi:hypothetical protein
MTDIHLFILRDLREELKTTPSDFHHCRFNAIYCTPSPKTEVLVGRGKDRGIFFKDNLLLCNV